MIELSFEVVGAHPERYAAEPTLMLELRITEADGRPVHAVALKCQVRIEPQRRRYQPAEEERLLELFGETPRWGDSLRPFLWTHVATTVPAFAGTTTIDLPITCTYDFEVSGTRYFHALADGEIPLLLLFSGTTFVAGADGFSVTPVAWHEEAAFRLPVAVWQGMMDAHYPNRAFVTVSRETLDGLLRYRAAHALPTWDLVLERLLKEAGAAGEEQ
jgi:hypothetical protein